MDLRVERTYKSLVNAFMELLAQKNFEDISVAELCERAMIRRTTFYKHFADKDEFLVFFVKEIRDDFTRSVEGETVPNGDAIDNCLFMLRKTLDFLKSHGQLVDNALASRSAPMIIDALGEVIRTDTLKQFGVRTQREQDIERQKNESSKLMAAQHGRGPHGDDAAHVGNAAHDFPSASAPRSSTHDPEMFSLFLTGGIVKMMRAWCEAGRPLEMEQRMIDMVKAARSMVA